MCNEIGLEAVYLVASYVNSLVWRLFIWWPHVSRDWSGGCLSGGLMCKEIGLEAVYLVASCKEIGLEAVYLVTSCVKRLVWRL